MLAWLVFYVICFQISWAFSLFYDFLFLVDFSYKKGTILETLLRYYNAQMSFYSLSFHSYNARFNDTNFPYNPDPFPCYNIVI